MNHWVEVPIAFSRTPFARFNPLDYFLFPDLKKWLGRKIFTYNEEVKSVVDSYYDCEGFDSSHYKRISIISIILQIVYEFEKNAIVISVPVKQVKTNKLIQ